MRVPDERVHALAATLGSDVPFFLLGGTALGLGRGDEVYPLENLPRHWVVLVIPPFGVATKDAYEWFDERDWTSSVSYLPETWLGRTTPLVNDLEAPVAARHPVITQLKQRFTERGALLAAMSGSGSTVFGIFSSRSVAAGAARAFRNEGAQVLTARFRSRRRP
jgi:4-diphosphocytidyl-2-C-methyl-D-erythritol kinase